MRVETLGSLGIEPMVGEVVRNVYTEHRVVDAPESKEVQGDEERGSIHDSQETTPVNAILPESEPLASDLLSSSRQNEGATAPRLLAMPSSGPAETEPGIVEVGDRVLIAYNDDTSRQHTIEISASEHDPDMEIIRVGYPLAVALLGAGVDEELEIPAGGGKRTVTVLGIEKDRSRFQSSIAPPDNGSIKQTTASMQAGSTFSVDRDIPVPLTSLPGLEEDAVSRPPLDASEVSNTAAQAATLPTAGQSYQAWNSHSLPYPDEDVLDQVSDQLVEIIDVEGPVLLKRLFHLHANAAGIGRVGRQLRALYLRATSKAVDSGRVELESIGDVGLESVARPSGRQIVRLRRRGPRDFDEIPIAEIREAMLIAFGSAAGIDEEDLYRMVLDIF